MSSRAYIRIEKIPHLEPLAKGMAWYAIHAQCDDGKAADDFEFEAPADLVSEGAFLGVSRAQAWIARALSEEATETDDAINALLPYGHVSLEVGLPSDESDLRGGGQRLAWKSNETLAEMGSRCEERDAQWRMEQRLPEPTIPAFRPRF